MHAGLLQGACTCWTFMIPLTARTCGPAGLGAAGRAQGCHKALPHLRPGQRVSCMPGISALTDKAALVCLLHRRPSLAWWNHFHKSQSSILRYTSALAACFAFVCLLASSRILLYTSARAWRGRLGHGIVNVQYGGTTPDPCMICRDMSCLSSACHTLPGWAACHTITRLPPQCRPLPALLLGQHALVRHPNDLGWAPQVEPLARAYGEAAFDVLPRSYLDIP